jgi:prepilin-type processing-associated H-X9-DG protein
VRNAVNGAILALIIILIGGILLTVVARVREAAARTQCINNLHQIALTVQSYEQIHYAYDKVHSSPHFPMAAEPNASLLPERRFSWLYSIEPYMEANSLLVRIDREKAWDAEQNRYLALTSIASFRCPGCPDRPADSIFAPTHYIGIAGIGRDAVELANDNPGAGFFGYERTLSSKDISASTLLMCLETSRASGSWTAAGQPTVRGLEQDGLPYLGKDGQFGGNHRGIANAAFADGSVRSLRESMDPRVLEAIATVKGSAGVNGNDLD